MFFEVLHKISLLIKMKFFPVILFVILSQPAIYKSVRSILGSTIASSDGTPTLFGILVHALVFFLIINVFLPNVSFASPMAQATASAVQSLTEDALKSAYLKIPPGDLSSRACVDNCLLDFKKQKAKTAAASDFLKQQTKTSSIFNFFGNK